MIIYKTANYTARYSYPGLLLERNDGASIFFQCGFDANNAEREFEEAAEIGPDAFDWVASQYDECMDCELEMAA